MSSLYEILDVPDDADADAIKAAHRRAVRKHHPDKGGNRENFEAVQKAYIVLSNPLYREQYDRTGKFEPEPDNEQAKIIGAIVSAFNQTMIRFASDFIHYDIIAETRKTMAEESKQMLMMLINLREKISTRRAVLKRLSFKGEVDYIRNAVNNEIKMVEAKIAVGEKEAELHQQAMAYLDNYGFDFDEKPEPKKSPYWEHWEKQYFQQPFPEND